MYGCVKAKGSSDNLFDYHLIRPQNIDPVARTQDHLAEISAQLYEIFWSALSKYKFKIVNLVFHLKKRKYQRLKKDG
jgi:hypothetical protein